MCVRPWEGKGKRHLLYTVLLHASFSLQISDGAIQPMQEHLFHVKPPAACFNSSKMVSWGTYLQNVTCASPKKRHKLHGTQLTCTNMTWKQGNNKCFHPSSKGIRCHVVEILKYFEANLGFGVLACVNKMCSVFLFGARVLWLLEKAGKRPGQRSQFIWAVGNEDRGRQSEDANHTEKLQVSEARRLTN